MKNKARALLKPVARIIARFGVHPNTLTVTGFLVTVVAAIFYAEGRFVLGALVLLFAGLFDVFDGDVARLSNKVTRFGAFLDSTLDRFTEFFIFSGFAYHFKKDFYTVYLIFTALFLSLMVSYTRARGEGLGYSTKKGPMDRPSRYFYIIVISFLPVIYFELYISVFIILTLITVLRRIYDLKKLDEIKEV